MDGRILMATMIGAAISVLVAFLVVKRQWWKASGICALGTEFLLGTVTEGNRSRIEHNVVFAVGLVLIPYSFAVAVATARTQERRRDHL